MANDIDTPPLYDAITRDPLSNIWMGWFSTFYQTLTSYLTSGGVFLPQITTEQRDGLKNPQNGQLIYNSTLETAQYYKAGAWVSI